MTGLSRRPRYRDSIPCRGKLFFLKKRLSQSSVQWVKFRRGIARAERDGTRAETRFRLSPKRKGPFKSVGASVQSTVGSRVVRISFSNAG